VPRAAWFLLTAALLAAVSRPRRPVVQVRRILRISRIVADLDAAETFYRTALAFRTISQGPMDPTICSALGLPAAREVVMQLNQDIVALVQLETNGRPYPSDSASNDLWFQHLAIVVSDMDAAYAHLSRFAPGTISRDGPVLLPPANGSVRAFKFRDPDGHPLELIWFPPGQATGLFLGIDHSALAIASTPHTLRFYRTLGMRVTARSWNQGAAQNDLDGLDNARVRVTGLRATSNDGPGLELLAYHPPGRPAETRAGDIAADWVTLAVASLAGERHRVLRDPDGHRLLLLQEGNDP
jgi:catechol 2,3-dioxygenase-like lactoylglutathione lyase family enzyme